MPNKINYGEKKFNIGDVVYNIHNFQTPFDKNLYDFSKPLEVIKIAESKAIKGCQIVHFKPNTSNQVPKNFNPEPFISDWFDYYVEGKTIIKIFMNHANKIRKTNIKSKSS